MSVPVFRVPVTPQHLQLQGGAWVLGEEVLNLSFTPGSTGNPSPYLRHVVDWGDGVVERGEPLPTGRPYQYAHRYQEPGSYTVEVALVNDAGESSAEPAADPEGLLSVRQLPPPSRRTSPARWSGPALPGRSIRQSFAIVADVVPETTTTLAAGAAAGDMRVLVSAVPGTAEGATATIYQAGRFITSATVVLSGDGWLELDAALEDAYDAFTATVTLRRPALRGESAFAETPYREESWNLPAATDRELVKASLALLFGTRPYERVMRPHLGCRVHEEVFEPNDAVTARLLARFILDAAAPEPRATVDSVSTEAAGDQLTARTVLRFTGLDGQSAAADFPLDTAAGPGT